MIQLMDLPDSEEEGVTSCKPWMDSYPINNGLVFGGVGTSGGYALDDGTSEGLFSDYQIRIPRAGSGQVLKKKSCTRRVQVG